MSCFCRFLFPFSETDENELAWEMIDAIDRAGTLRFRWITCDSHRRHSLKTLANFGEPVTAANTSL